MEAKTIPREIFKKVNILSASGTVMPKEPYFFEEDKVEVNNGEMVFRFSKH